VIQTLHISNYALIDNVDINLSAGLNIITGETGAGKSIMLGALSLLLGARSDQRVVTDPTRKSVVEASFTLSEYPGLRAVLDGDDIDWDDDRCILRREIAPNGRSRAFINDSPVTVARLSAFAEHLVDLHSQHNNMLLARPEYQLRILDSLCDTRPLLEEYASRYNRYREALRLYHRTRRSIEADRTDREYLQYQYDLIDELKLVPGEQEEMERERDFLSNVGDIKSSLQSLVDALSEGERNVSGLLYRAVDDASDIADSITDGKELAARLEAMRIEADDIAGTYMSIYEDVNADPERLEFIENRLDEIYTLEHKYHVETLDELIEYRDSLKTKLADLDSSDDRLHELEMAARRARAAALETARKISGVRTAFATELAERLGEMARPLGMKNLRCVVEVKPTTELTPTGVDTVTFLFSFNKNQEPATVGNTASGGEISRLMLVIKSMVADKMQLPTIIFDEVDTGVSGDVADRMGAMMLDISRNIQVIAITHLPQVAAKGTRHFRVYKEDDEHSTHTRVQPLDDEQRVDELAVMLSGNATTEAARANARSLLNK